MYLNLPRFESSHQEWISSQRLALVFGSFGAGPAKNNGSYQGTDDLQLGAYTLRLFSMLVCLAYMFYDISTAKRSSVTILCEFIVI